MGFFKNEQILSLQADTLLIKASLILTIMIDFRIDVHPAYLEWLMTLFPLCVVVCFTLKGTTLFSFTLNSEVSIVNLAIDVKEYNIIHLPDISSIGMID